MEYGLLLVTAATVIAIVVFGFGQVLQHTFSNVSECYAAAGNSTSANC